jgi:hypothetical protein
MAETNDTAMDKLKNLFHEDVQSRTEISGGMWDSRENTYTVTDEASGVRTVYSLKKSKNVESGYSVKVHSYKDLKDSQTGITKQIEVAYDKKSEKWITKSTGAKAMDALNARPKYMATLNEQKIPGQPDSIKSLVVEPAKVKPKTPVILVPVRS